MAVNKSSLRALVVLEFVEEEESNGEGKKEKNLGITQTLFNNYEWKTEIGLKRHNI